MTRLTGARPCCPHARQAELLSHEKGRTPLPPSSGPPPRLLDGACAVSRFLNSGDENGWGGCRAMTTLGRRAGRLNRPGSGRGTEPAGLKQRQRPRSTPTSRGSGPYGWRSAWFTGESTGTVNAACERTPGDPAARPPPHPRHSAARRRRAGEGRLRAPGPRQPRSRSPATSTSTPARATRLLTASPRCSRVDSRHEASRGHHEGLTSPTAEHPRCPDLQEHRVSLCPRGV
jgi:hypothetical protein